ncbi:MAG TPA: AAA family ATPase [Rhizobacter sp.]|nr:AAA family ATPase [Rhizobacter sp.]
MYAKFFGLRQEPFSIAPDPRYLYMSERHREALAHLLYGLRGGGGFVLLTGEIGAGKTTVCRCFLEQIPKRCNFAYIFNPKLTVIELLKTVCDEFGIPLAPDHPRGETVKEYIDPINEFLLKTHAVGQNNVLIIDEAQNLSSEVLEQLRLLTNLETSERKLLQIILIGQPELRDMLARPELEQLAQRVTARYHLQALTEAESAQYIRHRLGVAGLSGLVPFDRAARKRIHQLSRGVPRRINLLCDRSLLGAYGAGRSRVDRETVDKAALEVFGENDVAAEPSRRVTRVAALASLAGLLVGAVLFGLVSWATERGAARPAVAKAASGVASSPAVAAASAPVAAAASAVSAEPVLPVRFNLLSESAAWHELAPAWKATLGEGDPCASASRQQLQCFKSDGGLALIRQLARPCLLTLYDEAGKPGYALLVGLTNQSASLRAGGVTQTVSLQSLARTWRGEFATLWRMPPNYESKLVTGNTGPAVDWLAMQLAKVNGDKPPAGTQKFDAGLQAKVSAFQVAQGLRPDGRVGPVTVMQLNRAAGVDEPRLQVEMASN